MATDTAAPDVERALFWATTIAAAAPLLSTKYLPFTDLPEHVAAIATIERWLRGTGDGTYEIALGQSQYLLYDLIGAGLARVVGDALLAHRILLTVVAVLWPVALRSLLRALGREERTAILAPMVFWNRALVLGFMPFIGSVPVCFFALAAVVRQCRAPRPANAVLLAVLGTLLFYLHVSAWVTFMAIAMGFYAVALFPRFTLPRLLPTVAPLVPGLLLAALWWRAGSLTAADGSAEAHRMSLVEKIGALTIWTFDVWRTHVDEVCSIVWWSAFAVIVVKSAPAEKSQPLEGKTRSALFLAVPLTATLAIYFATPFAVGAAAYLDVRLAPLVALFALVLLRPRADVWGRVPLVAGACATLLYAGSSVYEIRRIAQDVAGDFDALLAKIPDGRRLATLNFASRHPRVHYFPYIFAGSYHRVSAEAVAFYSFTDMAHWPVHFAPEKRPPGTKLYSLSPCAFQLRRDGEYFDYVLVQGPNDAFGSEDAVGPRFRAIAKSGRFTLFEKAEPESAESASRPDRSTCAPASSQSGYDFRNGP